MNWKKIFDKTALEKGKRAYQRQRVQNMQWDENEQTVSAEVVGSIVYRVEIKNVDGKKLIMSCSCPESENGSCCSHMAAVIFAAKDMQFGSFEEDESDWMPPQSEKNYRDTGEAQAEETSQRERNDRDVEKAHSGESSQSGRDYRDSEEAHTGESSQSGRDYRDMGDIRPRKAAKKQLARKKTLADYLNNGAVRKGVSAKKRNADREIYPFEHVYDGDDSYRFFDIRRMTEGMHFMEKECRQAREMIEQGSVVLKSLEIGHLEIDGRTAGIAKGTYRGVRHHFTSDITLTFDRNQIITAMCYSGACYRSYDRRYGDHMTRLCVHQTALLFLMAERLYEENPGDSTDIAGQGLIESFRNYGKQQRQLREPEEGADTYDIQPRVNADPAEGLRLSFRIGKTKLFVVKDIHELIRTVNRGGKISLGKKDSLDFMAASPTAQARRWLRFMKNCEEEELERENLSSDIWQDAEVFKNFIPLYGSRLDTFYELLGETEFEFNSDRMTGGQNGKSFLTAGEDLPGLDFVIENDTDEKGILHGIFLHADVPGIYMGKDAWYFVKDSYFCRASREKMADLELLLKTAEDGEVRLNIGRKNLSFFYRTVLPVLHKYGEVREPEDDRVQELLPPEADYVFYLEADKKNVFCRVAARYGEQEYEVPHRDDGGPWDMEREQEICKEVMAYFPEWDEQRGCYHCGGDEDLIYRLLENGVEHLIELGEVQSTERFRGLKIRPQTRVSVGVSVGSEIMNLEVTSEDISQDELLEVLKSYKKKKHFYRLRSGDFIRMDDDNLEALENMMESMHLKPKEFVKGKLQLPLYRAFYLDKLLEENDGLYTHRDSNFRKMVKEFKTVKESDYEVPDSLAKIMRNYQIYGHKWLRTLESCGFGGILADDMGLGKTLQTISVLLAAEADLPSLIVCPASLVYNWKEEFARFAPSLRVQTVTGTREERQQILSGYTRWDVLVTSYDLLKRDIGDYEPLHFAYQVIDEAQYIKNHNTAAAKSVKVIKSRTRYALTGTPIENRLSELWSIFDYLMPGFLYGYETFRSDFEQAITRRSDGEVTERLRKMVAPFILRRLKSDVLRDLPEKMEEVRYARLEKQQQKLYDGQVVHMKQLLDGHSDEDYNKDKLQILAELTRIRQICCDPQLLFEDYNGGSAKREACLDLIESAIEGEHRILLFSQFTTMLELLEKDLDERNISHYKIVGSTPKELRSSLVRRFNAGNVPVFLISLKAGGTGLNLTGADVVIHYDPWWNVAAQNQATDRAHRIGQKKVVSVYKLIVKGSIEEKILKLQEEKKNLADQILSGEMGGLMNMSREELLELLQ